MIKEVKMYTVICDVCGVDCLKNEEYSCWNDKNYALDVMFNMEWAEDDDDSDKHYCPKCFEYDDDGYVIVKPKAL